MTNKKITLEYLRTVLILLVFSIVLFNKTLLFGEIFAWYNDQLLQHNVFYKEWYRIIKETMNTGVLAVYSWNTFLGSDFLISKLMYCVGDFLITPFFIIYSGEINYDLLYCVTTIVCIVLSGINMLIYINKLSIKKEWLRISIPIIYALGGFVMTYTGSYMFHRFYTLLPLLFFFCERYIQDNKLIGFSLITMVLFFQSYELLFSTCFFLVLYFIVRYKLCRDIRFVEIIKKSIPLIISFFLGIMLCGFVLIPLVIYLKSNPRVGNLGFDGLLWDYKTILGFITSMVIPAFNFRSDNPSYLFHANEHYGSEYGVFTTIIFLLAFFLIIKKGTKEEKHNIFIGEIIIIICLIIKPLNSIIHGFSVPNLRWSFLLEFYHLLVVIYAFDKHEYDNSLWKEISISYLFYIVLYIVYIILYKVNLETKFVSVLINISAFSLAYLFDFLLIKGFTSLLTICLVMNILIMYSLSIYSLYGIYGKDKESYENEYLQYHVHNDEDLMVRYYFVSEELWPYSWLNLNDSVNNDYMSVTTYDSTYESVLNNFLQQNGYGTWMIDMRQGQLLEMLGVKYIVTTNSNSQLLNDINVEKNGNLNNYTIYKLKNYKGIAYTVSNVTTQEDNNVDYSKHTYVDEKDMSKLSGISNKQAKLDIIEYSRQYFKGTIDINEKSLLFVATPYSKGWNVFDQDGNKLETVNINNGFLGVILDSNVKEVSFYYGTPGLKVGLCLSSLGIIGLIGLIVIEKRAKHA